MPNLPSDTDSTDVVNPTDEVPAGAAPVTTPYSVAGRTKYALIGLLILLSFFAAYGFASARSRTASAPLPVAGAGGEACATGGSECGQAGAQSAAPADACTGCETGAPAETPQAAAVLDGDVQTISVDVSKGYFDPTVIDVAAGVPTEITFGQGSGCLAEVEFPQFDISKDLTQGGAVVTLPALDPGEYQFNCGMQMVFGTLIVH